MFLLLDLAVGWHTPVRLPENLRISADNEASLTKLHFIYGSWSL